MEASYKKRTRIEVSTSVKGIKTYSLTVEHIDDGDEAVLAHLDYLVDEMDKRCPAPETN